MFHKTPTTFMLIFVLLFMFFGTSLAVVTAYNRGDFYGCVAFIVLSLFSAVTTMPLVLRVYKTEIKQ